MKTGKISLRPGILALLLAAMLLTLSGCVPDLKKGDAAEFVRNAAEAITLREDKPELFHSGDDILVDLENEPKFQPYFAILDMQAEADPGDPELVRYSCRIPGPVGIAFNAAFDKYFSGNEKFSPFIEVSGEVRVLPAEDGGRQIDISGRDNVFAAYAALRYVNPLYFSVNGVDISKGVTNDNLNSVLNVLLSQANGAYAGLAGKTPQEYSDEVTVPQLQEYQQNFQLIRASGNDTGYGWKNWVHSKPLIWKIVFGGLAAAAVAGIIWGIIHKIIQAFKERKKGKGKKADNLRRSADSYTAQSAEEYDSRLEGISGEATFGFNTYRSFRDAYLEAPGYDLDSNVHAAAKSAILMALNPDREEGSEETLRFLCKNIHLGLHYENYSMGGKEKTGEAVRQEVLTCAGWSAAALGRLLARKMEAADIPKNREKLEKAIDAINLTGGRLQEKAKERTALARSIKGEYDPDAQEKVRKIKSIDDELKQLETEYNKGIGGYMLDNGDLPLAYLAFLLGDSQNQFPRFIKQGVIMGLVDWLVANRNVKPAEELLRNVVAVRAQMIQSDNELTFFEVRAPRYCSRNDYALLLADVLHCANPSLKYGDAGELLNTAEKEIPGVMEMLRACPLRLIDPANKGTQGFYQFKPYVHAAWTQYIPPTDTGKVIRRYHEVDDRTKPLSSGLNLSLFRDARAVIPTLYHEYQHFRGDRNEASVFLKTQLFSIKFYKKYPDAEAKADSVFAQLTTLLGLPPAPAKREAFNALIEKYYGKQLPKEQAERRADLEIAQLNGFIDRGNKQQTWDPDKKWPRFSENEDRENMKLIREIVIRFATVPKSLDENAFKLILAGKPSTPCELVEMPVSTTLQGVADFRGMKEGIEIWLSDILAEMLSGDPGDDLLRAGNLLHRAGLSSGEAYKKLEEHIFDKEAHNPKTVAKYLKKAEALARAEGRETIEADDLVKALLRNPTKTMGNAGFKKLK